MPNEKAVLTFEVDNTYGKIKINQIYCKLL